MAKSKTDLEVRQGWMRERPTLECPAVSCGEGPMTSLAPVGRKWKVNETVLDLTELTLSGDCLDGLLDDWIVSALVDRFRSEREELGEAPDCGDNR